MKRAAVFFDRDNTLIASDGYLGDPNKVVLIDGAAEAVAKCRQYGFKIVVVSNQSGVARGMFTEADVQAVNTRLEELLRGKNANAIIDRHEYCPCHPEATIEQYRQESDLRKPRPGMLLKAAEALKLDLSRCWLIGDALRDIEAGKAAGCRTILFTAPGLPASPEASKASDVQPEFTADSLKQAIDIIAREVFIKAVPKPANNVPPAGSPVAASASGAAPPVSTPSLGAPTALPPSPGSPEKGQSEDPAAKPCLPQPAGPVASISPSSAAAIQPASRTDKLLEQILAELKRHREAPLGDFSISKLLAGAVQSVALATLLLAFFNRTAPDVQAILLFAIALQTLTIALLIMSRQR
ncbi:MAG: HAD family hydrolase [Tepidisphaeraceae bacterium]|jgi:D-glycero-D-manno-heptose 1,7-bisphosphate phosphatase